MCGIAGFIRCGSASELEAATDSLAHRGPDDRGIQWFNKLHSGLGHRRLSIIDLSKAGAQPLYHQAGRNWIIFNGELFNYRELRQDLQKLGQHFNTATDTEVVAAAYLQWGSACLERFNGMFAFAILNEEKGHLFIARDRLGIKPLYYYQKGDKLIFASEIKAILQCRDYEKQPDFKALHNPAHYQAGPFTGFKDILKLPPGCFAEMDDLGFRISRYWSIQPREENRDWKDAANELDSLLQDSIRLQMISDVPVGSLLSGGLDSSLISVLMQKQISGRLNTFTIRFREADRRKQGNVDDAWYARRLARDADFDHQEILIEPDIASLLPKLVYHLDEPIADPAAINTYLIASAARERGIYVLLSGIGADEVYGGYRAQYACLQAERYQQLPFFIRGAAESLIARIPEGSSSTLRRLKRFSAIASKDPFLRYILAYNSALSPDLYRQLYADAGQYAESPFIERQRACFESSEGFSYLTRICLNDSLLYLPDHNLTYTDKASMAAGVESRPPLIDHRMVELLFSLPPDFRIKGKQQKVLLKEVASRYLPGYIIQRPKAPFSAPMRAWLKNELKPLVDEVLSADSLKSRGLYQPATVARLQRENNSGKHDHSQLIWRMMVNEIWFRTFFDK
jgi:asparagine synthase (glutamine-hydrolysing)